MRVGLVAVLLAAAAGCGRTVLRPTPCPEPAPPLPHSAVAWQAAPGPPRVTGRVQAVSDSAPAGAEVALAPVGSRAAPRVERPGPGGTFRFEAVPPGRYVLSVRRIGYFRAADTLRVAADSGAAAVATLARDYVVLDGCGYAYAPTRLRWWHFW